jgi:glycine cleavage system regulatory protein
MSSVVITLIGDDQAGLVGAVAKVVTAHGGNWDRSHLAELAGKFAGIVLVTLPEDNVQGLLDALDQIEANGLLAITAERSIKPSAQGPAPLRVALELMGQDHAGIVQEVSQAIAALGISIDELETAVAPAPQGGNLFIANAILEVPGTIDLADLRGSLEAVAHDLMVDLDLVVE